MKKIRVLVVDDSALMRRILGDIIAGHHDLVLAGTAGNGLEALVKIEASRPDVLTLDLEMPHMGGLETLRHIMNRCPLPVIVVGSHTRAGSESAFQALSAGAVDFIAKPAGGAGDNPVAELRFVLPQKIRAAASVRPEFFTLTGNSLKASAGIGPARLQGGPARAVVAIGASTGGPRALEHLFTSLGGDLPAAVLVTLHMPPGFTLSFANRLNTLSALQVAEGAGGTTIREGLALIAPGGFHMKLRGDAIYLDDGPKVNFVRPSVDVMLESLLDYPYGIIVVMLTGMGRDGAEGAARLKEAKQDTIILVQDPATAIIPGMPEAVLKNTTVTAVVPLEKMAEEIFSQADRLGRIAAARRRAP